MSLNGKHRDAGHDICNLKYNVPKIVTIVLLKGSNCDYHFIIKELAEEFKKQSICLREKTEKYMSLQFK